MDCKELIVEEKMQKKIDIKAILKKLNISVIISGVAREIRTFFLANEV